MRYLVGTALLLAACGGAETRDGAIDLSDDDVEVVRALPDAADQDAAAQMDLVAKLAEEGRFTTLLGALRSTGLDATLNGGTYTLFAPTDAAFAALPQGTLEGLSSDELSSILTAHALEGEVLAGYILEPLQREESVTRTAVGGGQLTFTQPRKDLFVTTPSGARATVTTPDILTGNGVVHVIDGVLVP